MAIRFHSMETSKRGFPMRKHFIEGSVLVALILAMRITDYFCGMRLNGFSLVSPMMPIVLGLMIMLPVVFIRTIQGLYHGISGKLTRKQFGQVFLPGLATAAMLALPIPSFNDGVARRLRKTFSAPELVAMAKSIKDDAVAKAEVDGSLRSNGPAALPKNSLLNRLELSRKPMLVLGENSIDLLWGGALANAWGIAISSEAGKKPALGPEVTQSMEVYPEVVIYTLID